MKNFLRTVLFAALLFPTVLYAASLNLDGINYDEQNPPESIAIINGELLKAGQKVGDYEITKIELTKVHLKNASGEEAVLDMNQEFKSFKREVDPARQKAQNQQKSFAFFDNFQKKANSSERTAEVKNAQRVNHWDAMMTSIQGFMPGSGPLGAYRNFADNLFRGNYDEAKKYAASGSPAASSVDNKIKKMSACHAENGKRFAAASYKLESEKKDSVSAELVVIQTARGDPPGVTSAFGQAAVIYKHKAKLSNTKDGWKVQTFSYQRQTTGGGLDAFWLCVD